VVRRMLGVLRHVELLLLHVAEQFAQGLDHVRAVDSTPLLPIQIHNPPEPAIQAPLAQVVFGAPAPFAQALTFGVVRLAAFAEVGDDSDSAQVVSPR
jgi:hypothetical protein